jgi:predicted AAA+ superfamily ATPase
LLQNNAKTGLFYYTNNVNLPLFYDICGKIFYYGLEKKYENYLNRWKLSAARKRLIIRGARQVGKITLTRVFAKTYGHTIVLNLEKPADRRLLRW